jgi:hypothetical protein
MDMIKPSDIIAPKLYLSKGEMEVLALMAAKGVTIRQIKDAVQALRTTDMGIIASVLKNGNS